MDWDQPTLPGVVRGTPPPARVRVDARAEIVRLKAAGNGASQIARSLNARGVPTPTGRGQWWPETVRRHADPHVAAQWRDYIARYRALHRAG